MELRGAAVTAAANGQITGVTSAATVHEEAIFGYLAEDKDASAGAERVQVEVA